MNFSNQCTECLANVHAAPPCGKVIQNELGRLVLVCVLCRTTNNIQDQRTTAKRNMESQAEKMLHHSKQRFQQAEVGQTVVVRIPDVDRGRTDPLNIMAVIIKENNGFYELGTKHGRLDRKYARNEFEICSQNFITVEAVPGNEITLRQAVGAASISGRTQGVLKCNCKTRCVKSNCTCRNANVQCNSRCHNSSSCDNK